MNTKYEQYILLYGSSFSFLLLVHSSGLLTSQSVNMTPRLGMQMLMYRICNRDICMDTQRILVVPYNTSQTLLNSIVLQKFFQASFPCGSEREFPSLFYTLKLEEKGSHSKLVGQGIYTAGKKERNRINLSHFD